ncbi:RNA polymerase sigma-70 factor, ECF subfamily [Fodinibius sediminis]|uniref:RNA polymerase sigma-70 factor, ECF subfamily n=1 Tax=Fodinibius sediminis TaxID=1214077 RepID=A0A521BGJ0_9BACT|nr:RNA polymerase sigma-70 factor, ECF subfamily [Fodinibius sediminis]
MSRLCLDQLKSARSQREQYQGPWLPEPVVTSGWEVPDSHTELTDSLTIAFLHLMEQLNPVQRAVFLLHDIFGYTFKEIAEIIDRKPDTCRKIVQRSRPYIQEQRPMPRVTEIRDARKAEEFILALQTGEIQEIERLLANDAILYSDGGGEVTAAPKLIVGSHKIGRFLRHLSSKKTKEMELQPAQVNRRPGILILGGNRISGVLALDIQDNLIAGIYVIRNPHKIQHLGFPD